MELSLALRGHQRQQAPPLLPSSARFPRVLIPEFLIPYYTCHLCCLKCQQFLCPYPVTQLPHIPALPHSVIPNRDISVNNICQIHVVFNLRDMGSPSTSRTLADPSRLGSHGLVAHFPSPVIASCVPLSETISLII